jgi:hypothetical protein
MEKNEKKIRTLEKKWGNNTVSLGWTAIPNILLERQQALGLDCVDLNILLVLMKHWWDHDRSPYPSKQTIADIIGRDKSTVQKHIVKMESNGIMSRVKRHYNSGGQTSNGYDLSGLISKVKVLAKTELKEKKDRDEDNGRKRRGYVSVDNQTDNN